MNSGDGGGMGHLTAKWLRPFVQVRPVLAALSILALSAILGPLPASAQSSQASPASVPETCSDALGRWLAKYRPAMFSADEIWKFNYFRQYVWRSAFARLSVMIVPMPDGGNGAGPEGVRVAG
jgi:hypothetical protein